MEFPVAHELPRETESEDPLCLSGLDLRRRLARFLSMEGCVLVECPPHPSILV